MKKIKLFFLMLTLALLGVSNANANPEGTTDLKDLTVNFGSVTWGNWDYPWTFDGTHYAGDGNGDKQNSHVDVSAYQKVVLSISEVTGTPAGLRAFIWDEVNETVVTLWFQPVSNPNPNFTQSYTITEPGDYYVDFGQYNNLKGIKLPYGSTMSLTIDAAYVTPKPYPAGCVDIRNLTPSKGYSGMAWKNTIVYPKKLNSDNFIGNGEGSNESDHMNVSKYESLTFEITEVEAGKTCSPRIWVWDHKNNTVVTLYPYPADQYESTNTWTTAYAISTPGTYKVNLCGYKYLKGIKPNYGNGYVIASTIYATPKGITPIKTKITSGTATTALAKVDGHNWTAGTFPMENVGQNLAICGNGSDDGNNISDIKGYNYILIPVSKASGNNYLRTWVCSAPNTKAVTLFPHLVSEASSVTDWKVQTPITKPGIYVVKVTGYDYFNGIKTLQNWAGNDGSCDINTIRLLTSLDELDDVKVSLSGKVYEDEKGDLATWVNMFGNMTIDATDVDEGAEMLDPYSLKTEKDNSIYNVTFTGSVDNNSINLVNNGTCANLKLTDGKPFALNAEGVTVASASYDRLFNGTYFTVCLPFAATFEGPAYEYKSENTEEVTFKEVEGTTLTAGKAYLVGPGFAVTGGSGALAAAPADGAFKGTFEKKVLSSDASTSYYGFSNDVFVKVGSNVTVNPFRAYLTSTSSAAKLNVIFGGATGINKIDSESKNNAIKAIYGVDGAQKSKLTKGINVLTLQNGETVKVNIK